MSILTDIFVSSASDAPAYESRRRSGQLADLFKVVEFKGLTNLEFGTLWAIIEGKEFDFDEHALESLIPQRETWLFRFPSKLVQQLAALSPTTTTTIAEAWANTEELRWEPSEAEEVLAELVSLARLAISSSKGLFFWGCV